MRLIAPLAVFLVCSGSSSRIEPIGSELADQEQNAGDQWTSHRLSPGTASSDARISPDGRLVAGATSDGRIHVWDAATKQSLAQSKVKHSGAGHVRFNGDGRRLVSWSRYDRRLWVWDAATLTRAAEIEIGKGRSIKVAAFIPKSEEVAVLSAPFDKPIPNVAVWRSDKAEVQLWDVNRPTPTPLRTMSAAANGLVLSDAFAFSQDGKMMATWDGPQVYLWDVATASRIGEPLRAATRSLQLLVFGTAGDTLATVDIDRLVTVWHVPSRTQQAQYVVGTDRARFVTLGDATVGGFADTDGSISLWDVRSGSPIGPPLTGHPSGLLRIEFSGDMKTMAAGTSRLVLVWNVPERRLIGRCEVGGPDLSPDRWGLAFRDRSVVVARQDREGVTLCGARPRE